MGKVVQADRRTWADGEAHESVVRLGSGTNLSQSEGEGRGTAASKDAGREGAFLSLLECGRDPGWRLAELRLLIKLCSACKFNLSVSANLLI